MSIETLDAVEVGGKDGDEVRPLGFGHADQPGSAGVVLQATFGFGQFPAQFAHLGLKPEAGALRDFDARLDTLADVLLGQAVDEGGGVGRVGTFEGQINDAGQLGVTHLETLLRGFQPRGKTRQNSTYRQR